MRRAIEITDSGEILRSRLFHPGNAHQASRHGPEQHVAVALIENQTGFRHVLPGDVEHQRRDGHEAAILPGGNQFIAPEDLAAGNPADIGPDHVDAGDVRVRV